MSKKKAKKHEPEDQEAERKPFYFMDSYEWAWTGFEWIIPDLGHWWFGHLRNRVYKFNFDLYDEFGPIGCGWCTIDHADQMILKCAGHPVFPFSPDPMFLRKWLDTWVELHYCRLWQHVFDTLRLKKGVDEFDAAHRADVLSSQFEQLFSPTWPRYPKVQKARRGSKRDKQMKTLDQAVSELPADEQAKIAARVKELMPEEYIELRGPDPSPYTAFQYCYRVLDRRDIEVKLQNIPGSEGRFYEGVKVAAMILGNDINSANNAANAAFNEIRRRVVYERLQVAGTPPEKPPAEPAIDAAGATET